MQEGNKIIVGLGKTGYSVATHLRSRGLSFSIVDSGTPAMLERLREEMPEIMLTAGEMSVESLLQASELIISPGVPRTHPAIRAAIDEGIPVIGDIEIFAREVNKAVVAITGSNGKSTVTSMLGDMLADAEFDVAVGGNLGTPALDLLAEERELYVLELSSFQLESTFSLKATVAAILNVSADHLDRYASMIDYVRAKARILSGAEHVVLNRRCQHHFDVSAAKAVTTFGDDEPDNETDFGIKRTMAGSFLVRGDELLMDTRDLRLIGRHNQLNTLACLAIGESFGIDVNTMLASLSAFQGLEHRCEWVRQINGVDFFNDSKATNIGATRAAVESLGAEISGKIILIAGGQGKGAAFEEFLDGISDNVRCAVLFGEDGTQIEAGIQQIVDSRRCESLQEAINEAISSAKVGDLVLFSPACASFDMFDNFEHRGREFKRIVQSWSDMNGS